jgi:hypothetical protein
MKVFKIITLTSLSLFGIIILCKAQLAPKNNQEPQENKEVPGVFKLDTLWNAHKFAVKPKYNAHRGEPVEIPNAFKRSDTIQYRKPTIKVIPLPNIYP